MENRSGLIVDTRLTPATGTAERDAAIAMLDAIPGRDRVTVGADKAYDTADFVAQLRAMTVTPHVAQKALVQFNGKPTWTHGVVPLYYAASTAFQTADVLLSLRRASSR
jgi:Transposase DDE domain